MYYCIQVCKWLTRTRQTLKHQVKKSPGKTDIIPVKISSADFSENYVAGPRLSLLDTALATAYIFFTNTHTRCLLE